jgi:hypothetical protein
VALKSKPLEQVRDDVPVHEVTQEDLVRVNILVPASLRRAWKTEAARGDTTVTDLILKAMAERGNHSPHSS